MSASILISSKVVAVAGNPNSGKTTLFNLLTGLRQKTANYPGVTVEKKEGLLNLPDSNSAVRVLDLPGAYSLLPRSMDEAVVHDVLTGIQSGTPAPDLLVIVVDASNLERNLFFAAQLIETGIPSILVLNMWDIATGGGATIDLAKLGLALGVPVIPTVGNRQQGLAELKAAIAHQLSDERLNVVTAKVRLNLPEKVEAAVAQIGRDLRAKFKTTMSESACRGEALRILGDSAAYNPFVQKNSDLKNEAAQLREKLAREGFDVLSLESELRYESAQRICDEVIKRAQVKVDTLSDKVDAILTHKVWGFAVFFLLMGLVFQSVFSWATVPMDLLSAWVDAMGGWAAKVLPEGQLNSLVTDGIIAGVGGVIVFLPQILLLFFFIAFFEDSGYMARAAFVLDRVMRKVGLNGKSFIPLLSSFACAVPSIMATRTNENKNDRWATILVAPLMSCSARLPVYTLMISAFIPSQVVGGFFNLQGLTLFSMYALSISMGLAVAAIFRRTLLKGDKTPFVLELPPYRMPNLRTVLITMLQRAKQFLYRAGTIIFALSILLWFMVSYPRNAQQEQRFQERKVAAGQTFSGQELQDTIAAIETAHKSEQIKNSFAGILGHAIEPAIRPLGFDWKIGIGLIASFAAREVLVSTLSIVYSVGDNSEVSGQLVESLRREVSPQTGKPVYSPLVAISVMVFFVLACQCISTVAVVRRETNSWRWPAFMVIYMTALAWTGSFLVYQIGTRLGY